MTALAEAGVPVELGISPSQNMKRLHAATCLPNEEGYIHIPCSFDESRLAKDSQELTKLEDDADQQIRHSAQAELLKQAHTTISGLGAASKHSVIYIVLNIMKNESSASFVYNAVIIICVLLLQDLWTAKLVLVSRRLRSCRPRWQASSSP